MNALVLVLLLSAPAQRPVYVMDLEPIGVDKALSQRVTEAVAKQTSSHASKVASQRQLELALSREDAEKLGTCEQDAACIARVTRATATGLVLSGSVGKIGNALLLNLSLIDSEQARPVMRAAGSATNEAGLLEQLPMLVGQLWGVEVSTTTTALSLRAEPRFVVLDFVSAGISSTVAKNLTQVVAAEAKRVQGASVLSRDDLSAMLGTEQLKSVLTGDCDQACYVDIAGALDADYLLVGQVGKIGGTFVAALSLLDQQNPSAADQFRVIESFKGAEAEMIRAMRYMTRKLLGLVYDAPGVLAMASNELKVEVFVDEEKIGLLPMPPKDDIPGGRHTIRFQKEGFLDWRSEIYVNTGNTTAVWVELKERPQRWYQKWWVWTLAGAVVAGGVTGAVVATLPSSDTGTIGFRVR